MTLEQIDKPKSWWRGNLIPGAFVLGVAAAWYLGFVPALGGETTSAPGERQVAMAFHRPTVDGQDLDLTAYKGKVVLVNMWATWCPPCRMEIPALASAYRRYRDKGFVVVGVSVDREGPGVVREFVRVHAMPYPVVMADAELVTAYGGIRAVPTSFLIDRQGRIAKKYVGLLPGPRLERDVAGLL